MQPICYRPLREYKYQLTVAVIVPTIVKGHAAAIEGDWVKLADNGTVSIKKGYAWDGPSGPMPDFTVLMRASLVHDAFYQLLREGKYDTEAWVKVRRGADRMFCDLAVEDGLHPTLGAMMFWGLQLFGARFAKPNALPGEVCIPPRNG